jgi:rhodanese-related sulfurtransferase
MPLRPYALIPLLLILSGVTPVVSGNIHKNISVYQADTLIRNHAGRKDFVILDVRTRGEFESGHVAGAIHIDFWSDTFQDSVGKLDKTCLYLVYCTSGVRSKGAVKTMRSMGFQRLYNLKTGMIGWRAAGMPVTKLLP